jgi:ABC-type molybdate transport system substrate-binding protein
MVFLVDWDKVNKISTSMLIIGIICVAVAGPVMTYGLSTWPVVPQGTQTIQETSMSNITYAYAYRFTIMNDEQISAKVSCTFVNNTVTVKILTASVYERAMKGLPDWNPGTPTGLDFMRSQPTIGTNPASTSVTSYTTTTTNSYAFIDFVGTSGRISPGSYVLIVYGDNSGTATDTNVKFDLQITQEIFGRMWGRIVNMVGWCLIIVFGVLAMVLYIKKTTEGRSI